MNLITTLKAVAKPQWEELKAYLTERPPHPDEIVSPFSSKRFTAKKQSGLDTIEVHRETQCREETHTTFSFRFHSLIPSPEKDSITDIGEWEQQEIKNALKTIELENQGMDIS